MLFYRNYHKKLLKIPIENNSPDIKSPFKRLQFLERIRLKH